MRSLALPARLAFFLSLLAIQALPVHAQPGWSVDPSAYEQSTTMVGILFLNGAAAEPNDIIAAFIGDEVRGVASDAQVQVFEGQRYYFLTVYSNTTGNPITFKAYDASTGEIRTITETFLFATGQVGSLSYPIIWSESPMGCTFGDPTTWTVDQSYEHTMTILGTPLIDTLASDDPNDRVAAFMNGEVRGVTPPPTLFNGSPIFFLSIGGNAVDENTTVTFQLFDHSKNAVRDLEQTLPFEAAITHGSPPSPFTWTTSPSCNRALLPVELAAFDAVADGDEILLTWETLSETNNAGFEIQQHVAAPTSFASPWQGVSFVQGQGTTEQVHAYSFRLSGLTPNSYRFRLKQIDYDGTFSYSPEIEIAIGLPQAFHLSKPYPNPFSERTQFSVAVARAQRVLIRVYDVRGHEKGQLVDEHMAAGQARTFVFEDAFLPSGIYFIRVQGEYFMTSQQIIRHR